MRSLRPVLGFLVVILVLFTLSTFSPWHLSVPSSALPPPLAGFPPSHDGPSSSHSELDLSDLPITHGEPTTEKKPSLPLPLQSGPVTARFRDLLLPHHGYVTSFPNSGWTNDVMATGYLLLLALLTRRTPILPPYSPSHLPLEAGLIPFGEVFDVERLSEGMGIPILEWHDIKNLSTPSNTDPKTKGYYGGEKEEVGCWTLWPTQSLSGSEGKWHRGKWADPMSLDISWTPVPFGRPAQPDRVDGLDWNLHAIADLGYPNGRREGIEKGKEWRTLLLDILSRKPGGDKLSETIPDKIPIPNSKGNQLDPDDQLFCVDYLYYVSSRADDNHDEWWRESGMVWHTVGRHMHWTPRLRSMASEYISHILDIPFVEGGPIPPYIAVHVRRSDFRNICGSTPLEECMAPLSAYATRVKEVRDELARKGFEDTSEEYLKVIVLSDEPLRTPPNDPSYPAGSSEKWWGDVKNLGWFHVDHDTWKTEEKYGMWYTVFLDAAIQSYGIGFVGTAGSTMSSIALRRTEEWSGGAGRTVRWGSRDADAH
ncbi:hypothetical protein SISSUDRAFT_1051183 [Sistotremastrum suecicum HHB10207 ss-3]|uniref:Uncharacterized protein n=1 Tax=Sistotremastrum suecicum HHB10207 ss-3 TaxID=1314776 RepID=A0A166ARS1_9AGAM|nr:hypothetical protein SISSUDRAFT_1051183 [Sistotremastrum suecicum HHB10207 ss-3]